MAHAASQTKIVPDNEETSIGSARRVKTSDAMPAPRRALPIEVIELSRTANL
jgi:hypothetical protein